MRAASGMVEGENEEAAASARRAGGVPSRLGLLACFAEALSARRRRAEARAHGGVLADSAKRTAQLAQRPLRALPSRTPASATADEASGVRGRRTTTKRRRRDGLLPCFLCQSSAQPTSERPKERPESPQSPTEVGPCGATQSSVDLIARERGIGLGLPEVLL